MEKYIEINGKKCLFKTSAAIPRIYRIKFNRDIFVDMQRLADDLKKQKKGKSTIPIKSLEMFENIAFLMSRHGDPSQPSNINDWLDQFETFDIYKILPEILELWGIENSQMSKQKKKTVK